MSVTCRLSSSEVKRERRAGEARRGHRHVDGSGLKLNCRVIWKRRDASSRIEGHEMREGRRVENSGRLWRGCLFSLGCC